MNLVVVPLVIAVALAAVPLLVKVLDRNAGWPLGVTFFAVAAYIIRHADPVLHGETQTWSITWIEHLFAGVGGPNSGNVELALRMDALSMFFTLLALIIGGVVFIYSASYLHRGSKILSFYLLMTTFMLAVLLLVLADDVALLFVGWELVSLASFFLIARSGSGGEAGSVRTLLLTFAGGLALLAGLGIAAMTTGSMRITEILTSDAWTNNPHHLLAVSILIALAGFSKAAQIPFHFWLPEAMAADTPVSAFLHAAAVVKAGVYLLMRFAGLFQGVWAWHVLLIVVGMSTAVMAAVFAIQKADLKKLTAYSTVSQLGWIIATIGVGTPFALAAAIVHTAAHALFKSSLFMLAGVIDHQAGSRHMHRLGSLWRQLPLTFIAVIVAAASMAAIPPTFGFVSKESMLAAFEEAPLPQAGVVALLVVAGLGALATMLYSGKYVTGAFIDGKRDMSDVKEAPLRLWLPAALPGLMSLPLVLVMASFDEPIDAVVAAIGVGESHTHLALWHGVNVPLGISVAVLAVGAAMLFARHRIIYPLEGVRLGIASGPELIHLYEVLANKIGRLFNRLANSMSPSRHLVWIILMLIALAFFAIMAPGRIAGLATLEPRVSGIDRMEDLAALVIIGMAVAVLTSTRSRMGSIVLLSIVGVGVSWQMLILGAPDVAMTNLLVEFCVAVIIMLIARHQPRLYLREGENRTRFATILAVVIGLITFFGVWLLIGRHDKPQVAQWYLENTPAEVGANNVVAAILVEFRAFDTLGELIVLGMAGIVIAAIVQSIPRSPNPGYGPGSTAELFRAEGSTRFPDVHKVPELAPFYSKYLRSTYLNSIISRQQTPYVVTVVVILSAWIFWRGHMNPGGAFLAALVAACGMLFYYMGTARSEAFRTNNFGYGLIGGGIILALGTGLVGYTKGSFLAPLHGYLGDIHLTSSLLFDGGVYLAVVGLIVVVVNFLGGRERPGAARTIAPVGATVGPETGAGSTAATGADSAANKQAAKHAPSAAGAAVAVHAGGSLVPLNPSEISEAERRAEAQHRAEREAARAPKPDMPPVPQLDEHGEEK